MIRSEVVNRGVVRILALGVAALLATSCVPSPRLPQQTNVVAIEQPATQRRPVLDNTLQVADVSRSQKLATLFDAAYMDQTTFGRDDKIIVRWPDGVDRADAVVLRIQTASGRIFLEKQLTVEANTVADLGNAYLIPAGDYEVVIMPSIGEYYFGGLQMQRKLAITLLPQ